MQGFAEQIRDHFVVETGHEVQDRNVSVKARVDTKAPARGRQDRLAVKPQLEKALDTLHPEVEPSLLQNDGRWR